MLKYENPSLGVATFSTVPAGLDSSSYREYERAVPTRSRSNVSRAPAPRAAAPDAIWGQYNNYRSTGVKGSVMVHAVLLGVILGGSLVTHTVVQQAKPREIVTLIAPSPDTYTMAPAKKEVSGGGGGGDRDHIQAPKGKLPKLAVEQITPPQIILRNEKPKLAVESTVVIPPQVKVADKIGRAHV